MGNDRARRGEREIESPSEQVPDGLGTPLVGNVREFDGSLDAEELSEEVCCRACSRGTEREFAWPTFGGSHQPCELRGSRGRDYQDDGHIDHHRDGGKVFDEVKAELVQRREATLSAAEARRVIDRLKGENGAR